MDYSNLIKFSTGMLNEVEKMMEDFKSKATPEELKELEKAQKENNVTDIRAEINKQMEIMKSKM